MARNLIVATLAIVLFACAKPAFTEAIRHRYALGPQDVRKMQFYTSDEIVLRREIGDQEKTTADHSLTIRNGVHIEEVVIPAHTPCVALRVEGDFILASFSQQHPERALWFGLKKTDDASPLPDARPFELVQLDNLATDTGAFRPDYSKTFLVSYAGQKYRVVDSLMWNTHLLFDMDESFAKERVREEPPGWRLSEGPVPHQAPASSQAPAAAASPAPGPAATPSAADAGDAR